jgi:hypothetical protein
MATGNSPLASITQLRDQRNTLDRQVYSNALQLQRLQAQLQQAQQAGSQDTQQLLAQIADLQKNQGAAKQNLVSARGTLNQAIAGLYGQAGPQQLIGQWADDTPITLLPVRIETRFNTTAPNAIRPIAGAAGLASVPAAAASQAPAAAAAANELWVRIYPDDIAVITEEQTLTDGEVSAGTAYWQSLYTAIATGGTGVEDAKKAAWKALVDPFGSGRAAWVALQTKPTNWQDDLSGIGSVAALVFPTFDLTKTQAWSRAPRTHAMPDKFVVMLYTGDTKVIEVTGSQVPDELIVGPDPLDQDSFVTSGNQLNFGTDFDWTSDFARAVSVGMGFRIPITPQQAVQGFDKLLVLGVYLSGDATVGQHTLEDLINDHHYSPKGFSLVPQGLPTNNTATGSSGFSKTDPFDTVSYLVEAGTPLFTDTDDCDGRNMADALGVDYSVLQHVAYSDGTDGRDAVLMNKCLYPGTLGYYTGSLLSPVLNAAAQDDLQTFFTQYVTGRGPLPAFRVGNQPYGILLTSDFSAWKEQQQRQAQLFPTNFLTTLYNVLNDYHQIWKNLLPQLMYAGKPGVDPSTVLLNILGLQSGAASFFQRNAYSTDNLANLDSFQYGGAYYADVQKNFNTKNDGLNWLHSFGYDLLDAKGNFRVPQILRLIYQHYTATLDPANLVDKNPVTETSPISAYDPALKTNYLDWLAAATTADQLNQQNFGAGIAAPSSLLYLLLRKSLLQSLHTASVSWFLTNGADFSATVGAINFHNIRPGGTLTKWEVMKAPLSAAIPAHPLAKLPIVDYLLGPGKTEPQARVPQEIIASLSELSNRSSAGIQRSFTEHLDTLTYRLDAWQTGLFDVRLKKMRTAAATVPPGTATQPAPPGQPNATGNQGSTRKQGVYLGAYGWLEQVKPTAKQKVAADSLPAALQPADKGPVYQYAGNGGLVQAPSLNHASAAAILRSGYLTHATVGAPDMMSVNLSSQRVRMAMLIMEGIRNGQTLNALLGYQLERALHDRASANSSLAKLNDYIYQLRDAFPIQQNLVQQQGGPAQETIPANDVVDGLKLAETTLAFPYGATGDITGASTDEQAAIEAEVENLDDTLDAVKDLLTVESVYQLTLGNYDRASATVNALQNGDLPPVLDSIDTPRGSQFSFTNRVTLQFANTDPGSAAANPWPAVPMTARAKMETGMNSWLGSLLGDPASIVAQLSQIDAGGNNVNTQMITLDQLGIQPIDLVYISETDLSSGAPRSGQESRTGVSELESRWAYVYRKNNSLDDSVAINIAFLQPQGLAGKRPLGTLLPLLRTVKSMITDSRYLSALDFDPPSQDGLADKNNPGAYDTAELLARVQLAKTNYEQQLTALRAIPIDAPVTDGGGTTTIYSTLGPAFDALTSLNQDFSDSAFVLQAADANTLQDQLITIADLSFGQAFPNVTTPATEPAQTTLLEQARSIANRMAAADLNAATLITNAAALTATATITSTLISAGKTLLGPEFSILPLFRYNNESDIIQSDANRTPLLNYAVNTLKLTFPADEWMEGAANARPRLARWDTLRMLSEANGVTLPVKPVQVPYSAGDTWLAVGFPDVDPFDPTKPFTVKKDTLSVVIHGDQAFAPGQPHCGLLIDDWTESIPTPEQITGITFNYNQPNSFPPQAILLAVPPVIKGAWDWNELVNILNDTLLRAKLRAVEPQLLATVNKVETSVLLPAVLSNFTQFDLDISLDYRMNLQYVQEKLPVNLVSAAITK